MPRVKRGTTTHRRHAALLERAKGFRTGRSTLFRRASEALLKAGQFAYRDRRTKKRDMRQAWIVRINAAVRPHGLSYSQFIHLMKEANVTVNRKILSDLSLKEPAAIAQLISQLQKNASK